MDLQQSVQTARDRLPSARTAFVAVLVSLGLIAVLLTALVATGVLAQPTVESIDKGWGTVSDDSTEIEAQVVVDNPNPVGIPGILTVGYTVSMNDVVLTENTESGIGLSSGENTIVLSSEMPNDRIADWWVTHVNNDERSTLTIDPSVRGAGFSPDLSNETSTIDTDLLSSFGSDGEETATLDGEPLMVIADQSAAWGQATEETTPITFTSTVENVHDVPVTLDGVEYVVKMNDVTLGEGRTDDGLNVQPGETGALTVDASLDTAAFADWWPTHVRDDETSQMTVELYGLVERNGTRTRVPIALTEQRMEFQTDLMGDGGTTVESLPTDRTDIERPTVERTDRQWGEVTDDTTEVHADATIENPNTDPEINEFVRIDTTAETTINDLVVGSGSKTGVTLSAGTNQLRVTTALDNDDVPVWWAHHINRGETSTLNTTARTTADIGFTEVAVATPEPNSTFETDLLADMNTDEDQPIEDDGETLLVAESTSAEWGEATAEQAPLDAESVVRNEQPVPVTVEEINYTVSINGVVLADDTHVENTVIEPGKRETIQLPMTLDNSKMDQWWVTHVPEERSDLNVNATATLSVGGEIRTVPLEMFSEAKTFETDILG